MPLPTGYEERKALPIATGVIDYFPKALEEIAGIARVSADADKLLRHFIKRGTRDAQGIRHSAHVARHAIGLLSTELGELCFGGGLAGFLTTHALALAAIAHVSKVGNDQHNPGEPLHWAREKSTDEANTLIRHFLERGTLDSDGTLHSAKMCWRALALLEKEIEADEANRDTDPTTIDNGSPSPGARTVYTEGATFCREDGWSSGGERPAVGTVFYVEDTEGA